MKTKMIALSLLIAFILTIFCSCEEADPYALLSGESKEPDVPKVEDVPGGKELEWPDDLLPDCIPKLQYKKIVSYEKVNNEVRIILLCTAMQNVNNMKLTEENTQSVVPDEDTGAIACIKYKEGWSLSIYNSQSAATSYLADIEADYLSKNISAYEYRIRRAEIDPLLFHEFPPKDYDFGLEEITFDKWPAEYLPDDFPEYTGEMISMKQTKNGILLQFKNENEGDQIEINKYLDSLKAIGYGTIRSNPPQYNRNLNYYYILMSSDFNFEGIIVVRSDLLPERYK